MGKKASVELCAEVIVEALEQRRIWPGLVVSFVSLALCNSFFCLGGVDQREYMPLLARSMREAGLLSARRPFVEGGTATGRCVDAGGEAVYPLDMLQGLRWGVEGDVTLRHRDIVGCAIDHG